MPSSMACEFLHLGYEVHMVMPHGIGAAPDLPACPFPQLTMVLVPLGGMKHDQSQPGEERVYLTYTLQVTSQSRNLNRVGI